MDLNTSCCCIVKCGASEALVKSGCCLGGESEITDGGANFFLPCCQMVQLLDLSLMTLKVESPHMSGHFGGPGGDDICVYTKDGVPVRVNSVAQVRIGPPPELDGGSGDEKERYLRSAASIFGDLSREACRAVITQTLEGHQRSMIGNMYAKELLMDRKAFAQEVNRSATVDLIGMGVWVTSFVIQDVKDDNEYISSLGKAEVAKKKEQARIGQAEMTRDAAIKEAEQERNSETKMFENKISEEEAKKDRLLKQAGIDFQTNQRTAVADMAQARKEVEVQNLVVEREQKVEVARKEQEIKVAKGEIERKKQELESSMIKPAHASAYKLTQEAEAAKFATEKEAEAKAAQIKLSGEAEAEAQRLTGKAEADAMKRKAAAWEKYSKATFLDKIIHQLPAVTQTVAAAVASTDNITIVSNNSTGGGGANKLAREVTDALATMPAAVEAIAGKEMGTLLKEYLAP